MPAERGEDRCRMRGSGGLLLAYALGCASVAAHPRMPCRLTIEADIPVPARRRDQ